MPYPSPQTGRFHYVRPLLRSSGFAPDIVCVANHGSARQQCLFRQGRRMRPPVSPPSCKAARPETPSRRTGNRQRRGRSAQQAEGAGPPAGRSSRCPRAAAGRTHHQARPGPARRRLRGGSPKPERGGPHAPRPSAPGRYLRGGGSAGGGTAHPAPRPGCPPRGAPLPRRARRPPQRPAAASRSVPALGLLRLTAAARAAPPSSPSRPLFVFIRCGRREGGTDGRRKGGRRRLSVRRRTFHTRPSAARPRVRREARRGAAGSAPPRSREAAARRICRAGSAPQRRAAAAAPLGWALRRPGLPGGWEPPRAGKGWVLLGVPGASKKRGIKRVAA